MDQTLEISDRILSTLEERKDDLVDLTQALIRIPTINPPGENYREICDFVAARLNNRGFKTEFVRAEGAIGDCETYPRWNLVAHHDGRTSGQCVHFNSHIDVVEVGAGWTKDPFGGELAGDKIYGRGACDMKGGLAASIIAVEAFIDLFPDYAGAIEISATADEETGGYGGVGYLAEKGYFSKERVQHVIIPEPLNKDRICLGHRGVWWAEIETFGEIAHGSMPFLGDCAIRHMGAVMEKMEQDLFPTLASRYTELPVVPDGAKQSTMNINSLHGGQDELPEEFTGLPSATVPDSCRMIIDRRFLPEEKIDDVKNEVTQLLVGLSETREDFRYRIREINEVLPTMTDRDAPVVASVSGAIEKVFGKPAEFVVSPGTYDQKHIARIGKLDNCIAYGPGILDLAHKPDEYVNVSDMMDSAQVMMLSLIDLLSVKT